jgi:hypothetical protein
VNDAPQVVTPAVWEVVEDVPLQMRLLSVAVMDPEDDVLTCTITKLPGVGEGDLFQMVGINFVPVNMTGQSIPMTLYFTPPLDFTGFLTTIEVNCCDPLLLCTVPDAVISIIVTDVDVGFLYCLVFFSYSDLSSSSASPPPPASSSPPLRPVLLVFSLVVLLFFVCVSFSGPG